VSLLKQLCLVAILASLGASDASADSTRRRWVNDPRSLRFLGTSVTPGSQTFRLAFAPDGQTLAAMGMDGVVRLFAVRTWEKTREFPGHPSGCRGLAFSPDGKLLAAGRLNGEVEVREMDTGNVFRTLRGNNPGGVYNVAFSPDGKLLLAAEENNIARVWSVRDGIELRGLDGTGSQVYSVAFSPDGAFAAGGCANGNVLVWKLDGWERIHVLTGHQNMVRSLAFSRDGRTLVSGGTDKTVEIWNLPGGVLERTLEGHSDVVFGVMFSPDGNYVTTAGDTTLRVWDRHASKEVLRLQQHTRSIYNLALHPSGLCVASRGQDDALRFWGYSSARALGLELPK